jgi:hypothetical protein
MIDTMSQVNKQGNMDLLKKFISGYKEYSQFGEKVDDNKSKFSNQLKDLFLLKAIHFYAGVDKNQSNDDVYTSIKADKAISAKLRAINNSGLKSIQRRIQRLSKANQWEVSFDYSNLT